MKAIRNGLWSSLAQGVGYLAGALGSILVVRSLSGEAYGEFSYYIWLVTTISFLGTLAFPVALTKISSELRGSRQVDEARALARSVVVALVGLNLLMVVGALAVAIRAPQPQQTYWLIVAAVLVPNALDAVLRSAFWGKELYRPVSIIDVLASLVQLLAIGWVFYAGWGAPGYVAAVVGVSGIRVIGLALMLASSSGGGQSLRLLTRPSQTTVQHYVAFFIPATLHQLFTVIIWQRSEVFFLERFSTLEEVGFYNLAYTVFTMFFALGWALVNGFYPAVSRDYGARAWESLRQKVRQALILATLYAVPLSFGGIAVLDRLLPLLYGPKMAPAVPVAQILFAGLLPGIIAGALSLTVEVAGGIWLSVRMGFLVAVLNVGLSLILIPRFGALGAAASSTTSQILYTLLLLLAVRKLYQVRYPWALMAGIIGVGLFSTFVAPKLVAGWLPGAFGLIIVIALAGVLYLLSTWRAGYLYSFVEAEVSSEGRGA